MNPDHQLVLDYHGVVISHPARTQTGYESRSEQIVRAIQRRQDLLVKSETEPLSRETSGLFLFLLQLCICIHLFAFAVY